MPAAWAVACGWPDAMADFSGAYSTEVEGEERIQEAGGLDVIFADACSRLGIPEVVGREYQAGDIAVIDVLGEQAGAVYTGTRWGLVADRGMGFASIADENLVRAWRVGDG